MDYTRMTKGELTTELSNRGIEWSPTDLKHELINKLVEDDKANARQNPNHSTSHQQKSLQQRRQEKEEHQIQRQEYIEEQNGIQRNEQISNFNPGGNSEFDFFNVQVGGYQVPTNQGYVRGKYHSTGMAFLWCLLIGLVTPFVMFLSFFYWPLIRKWLNYVAEFVWAWSISVFKWYVSLYYGFICIVIIISGVGVLFAYMFAGLCLIAIGACGVMYIRSIFYGGKTARRSREYYVENYLYQRN